MIINRVQSSVSRRSALSSAVWRSRPEAAARASRQSGETMGPALIHHRLWSLIIDTRSGRPFSAPFRRPRSQPEAADIRWAPAVTGGGRESFGAEQRPKDLPARGGRGASAIQFGPRPRPLAQLATTAAAAAAASANSIECGDNTEAAHYSIAHGGRLTGQPASQPASRPAARFKVAARSLGARATLAPSRARPPAPAMKYNEQHTWQLLKELDSRRLARPKPIH